MSSAINGNVDFSDGYWVGLVDEVSIWDEQLTADELRCLYDVGRELSYTADQFNALKKVHDAAGGSAVVEGREWQYATGLAGGAGLKGGKQLVLDSAAGTGLVLFGEPVSIPEPASFPMVVCLLGLVGRWDSTSVASHGLGAERLSVYSGCFRLN